MGGPAVDPESAARAQPAAPPPAPEPPSAHTIWVELLLYPTHTLPTAIAPVLVGLGLAARDDVLAPIPALVAFLGSWVIHLAGVFTDNHELLRKHPGLPEHPELNHALATGTLKLSSIRAAIAALLAIALATAPYLYRIGGGPVLAFGVVGIAASLSYNGGPWAYVRRGLADPVFTIMFAIAVVGTYFIQVAAVHGAPEPWRLLASLPPEVYVLGLPVGAIVTSVMLIDDIRDHAFDAAKGWRTGTVRFGVGFTRAEITALVALAYLAPVVFWAGLGLGAWVLLPLVSLPLAWGAVEPVWTRRDRTELNPATPRMARLAVVHSALIAVGLALSR
jgi:1,4-dihydroxy-2-naphthoate octaprenyltransferase